MQYFFYHICSGGVTGCVVEDTVAAGEEQGTSAGGELFGVEATLFVVDEQNWSTRRIVEFLGPLSC